MEVMWSHTDSDISTGGRTLELKAERWKSDLPCCETADSLFSFIANQKITEISESKTVPWQFLSF